MKKEETLDLDRMQNSHVTESRDLKGENILLGGEWGGTQHIYVG
jgi:hypothetical protein